MRNAVAPEGMEARLMGTGVLVDESQFGKRRVEMRTKYVGGFKRCSAGGAK